MNSLSLSEKLVVDQPWIYGLLLVLSALLVTIALGPGLFGEPSTLFNWQYQFFGLVCHQDVSRSFSLNGTQMAVCSRCLGIYSAFLFGLIFMPVVKSKADFINKYAIRLLLIVTLLNAIDIIGNEFSIWTNTLYSRLLLGASFGFFTALLLTKEFFKHSIKQEVGYGE